MLSRFRSLSLRRVLVMLSGVILISAGIALFKLSQMGNDPSTAFSIALGERLWIRLSFIMILCNAAYFLIELLFGRRLIGLGTFVNALFVGPVAELFLSWLDRISWIQNNMLSLPARLVFMLLGVVILSLGASMYQTADTGIAPYDALSIVLSRCQNKFPYFWCRIATDSLCAIFAALLGGVIGLGTLVFALALGPFITCFDRFVSRPLCGPDIS